MIFKKLLSLLAALSLAASPALAEPSPDLPASADGLPFTAAATAVPDQSAVVGTEAAGAHRVYASVSPAFALCEGLLRGMDEFTLTQLVQPQFDCIRLYDMSDWDYIQLSFAETCVIWGNTLESFEETLTTAESGPAVITLSGSPQDFAALPAGMADYDYYEHYTGENPNSYMSLSAMSTALDGLYESFMALYPEHGDTLTANYNSTAQLFADAISQRDSLAASAPAVNYAALFEGAPYMLDELGVSWQYVYPREPASEVTGADLDELLARLDANGISIVVLENQAPAQLKTDLAAAGYDVRCIASLITLDSPMPEDYISAWLGDAQTLLKN